MLDGSELVGIPIGNPSELYPQGDEIQTVKCWTPPDTFAALTTTLSATASSTASRRGPYENGPR